MLMVRTAMACVDAGRAPLPTILEVPTLANGSRLTPHVLIVSHWLDVHRVDTTSRATAMVGFLAMNKRMDEFRGDTMCLRNSTIPIDATIPI